MDIQTNHRVTLLNAKCEYVCAVDTLVKKMNYGEDVDCCINKLFLASRIINRLECYCFDNETTISNSRGVETVSINIIDYTPQTNYYLYMNGESIASYTLTQSNQSLAYVTSILINSLGLSFTAPNDGETAVYNIETTCQYNGLSLVYSYSGDDFVLPFNVISSPVCTLSNCVNCIEDKDLHYMYAVLNQLLQ